MKPGITIAFLLLQTVLLNKDIIAVTPEKSVNPINSFFTIQPEFGFFYYEEKNTLGPNRAKNFLTFAKINYQGVLVNRPNVSFVNSFTFHYFFNAEDSQNPAPDLSLHSLNLSDLLTLKSLFASFYLYPEDTDSAVIHIGRIFPFPDKKEIKFFENYSELTQLNGLTAEFFNASTGFFQLIFLDILNLYQDSINELYRFNSFSANDNLLIPQNNDDMLSFRAGLVYKTPDFFKYINDLDANIKFSFLFTRYGSVFGGNDNYSFNGDQVENDYIFYYNLNGTLKSSEFSILMEIGYTDGVDRRLPDYMGNSRDIFTNGMMGRAGVMARLLNISGFRHYLVFDFLYTEGPVFNEFSEKTNYGFTGIMNPELSYPVIGHSWGLTPYAISTSSGIINNDIMDTYHSSGMMNLEIKTGFDIQDKFNLWVNSIFLFDTINNGTNYMGNETAVNLSAKIFKTQIIKVLGGIFFPGEGYKNLFPDMYTDNSDVILAAGFEVNIYF